MNYFYELVKYDKNIPGRILMQDKPGWRCNTTLHWHPELEFVYMIDGSMKVTINGNEQTIKSGEFFFCNTEMIHSTSTPDNTSRYQYIVLLLSHDLLLRFHEDCLFDIHKENAREKLKNQLERLVRLCTTHDTAPSNQNTDIEKLKIILEICQILISDCAIPDSKLSAGPSTFTGYAKTVMEYVCENYNRNLSLPMIADKVGLSPQYLSKYFKKATNMGLSQYITLVRLEHANEYLINSNANITEAALGNGFADVKAYVRACKSAYGMTPSAYRKAMHGVER